MSVLKSFKIAKYGGKILTVAGDPILTSLGITIEAACDMAIHYVTHNELKRLESSIQNIFNKIEERLSLGDTPNDLSTIDYKRPIGTQLLEHTLIKCRDEVEEKKNWFRENIFVNILFRKPSSEYDNYDYQWGQSVLQDIDNLTYHQLILFVFMNHYIHLTLSADKQNYKEYVSMFQPTFGIDENEYLMPPAYEQLILNDFRKLYDMRLLCTARQIVNIENRQNTYHYNYPLFCEASMSMSTGNPMIGLIGSKGDYPQYIKEDMEKLEKTIFVREKLEDFVKKHNKWKE